MDLQTYAYRPHTDSQYVTNSLEGGSFMAEESHLPRFSAKHNVAKRQTRTDANTQTYLTTYNQEELILLFLTQGRQEISQINQKFPLQVQKAK